jgi:hypothetical protein
MTGQAAGASMVPVGFRSAAGAATVHNVQASLGNAGMTDPAIARDPRNRHHLISSGSGFDGLNCDGSADVGVYDSLDGGRTWSHACMQLDHGLYPAGHAPVTYDLEGAAYVAASYQGGQGPAPIEIERSTDNGTTWSPPAVAMPGAFNSGAFEPALEADNSAGSRFAGALYIAALQDDNGDTGITVSHSTDHGATWKAVVVIPSNGPVVGTPDLAVAPDGTVYLSYLECTSFDSESCVKTPVKMEVTSSTDGGVTWGLPVTVAEATLAPNLGHFYRYGLLPHTNDQLSDVPAIAVDDGGSKYSGRLYVTMTTWAHRHLLVEVFSSKDGGKTWRGPVFPAQPPATQDAFLPWVSVSAAGTVGVTWLDRRNDPKDLRYETFAAFSTDGGATFGAIQQVATARSNPHKSGWVNYLGWYAGSTWAGGKLYAVWPDTRTGSAQIEVGWF